MAPQPHRVVSPRVPALPSHQELGFPTEEDMLDWLENHQPPRPRPRRRPRPGSPGGIPLAWVAVGAAAAAVVRALSRQEMRGSSPP